MLLSTLDVKRATRLVRVGALLSVAMGIVGVQAKAEVAILCPNSAAQGGFTNTFSNFAGTLDGTSCGLTNTGVTLSVPASTDYAKLTWDASSGVPVGIALANINSVSASVKFTAQQAGDGPYFELSFNDPGCTLGQCTGLGASTDQILAIGWGQTGLTSTPFQTWSLDPNATLLHIYDNTTSTDLLGGISGAKTLDAWLSSNLSADSLQPIDQVRAAIGLSGGCGANPCAESLSVQSAQIDFTPEPSTWILMLTALTALVVFGRRQMSPNSQRTGIEKQETR
jgi:hypothetical protein